MAHRIPTILLQEPSALTRCITWLLALTLSHGLSTVCLSQTDGESAADRASQTARKLSQGQKYSLKYKLQKDDSLEVGVEQVVTTKFQMAGNMEESASRSASVKTWRVINVDQLGNMTFAVTLNSIDMWQRIGESDPVSYNSQKDQEIPDEYATTAKLVGNTLAVFTIAPNGQIVNKRSALRAIDFGVGKVTTPLPSEPVAIGHRWNVPLVLEANDEQGINRKLKARINYQLEKVKSGNAYIKFRTEVLTPVTSEKIRSTIMQKMTKGFVVFDIVAGKPVLKKVDWNEKAQGFEGADSFLEYVGRMSERVTITTHPQVAGLSPLSPQKAAPKKTVAANLRLRDDKPVLRK